MLLNQQTQSIKGIKVTRRVQRAQTFTTTFYFQIQITTEIQFLDQSRPGILDPDSGYPNCHQNLIIWSLGHAPSLQKKLHKNPFRTYYVDEQTNRQTDRPENITSFFGGGKYN